MIRDVASYLWGSNVHAMMMKTDNMGFSKDMGQYDMATSKNDGNEGWLLRICNGNIMNIMGLLQACATSPPVLPSWHTPPTLPMLRGRIPRQETQW